MLANLSKVNYFMYLAMVSFVFITTSALALSKKNETAHKVVELPIVEAQKEPASYAPLPTLSEDASFPILSAQAVLATDLDSGVTLYEKDPDSKFLPASTTKIITALVAMDHYSMDQVLKVGKISVAGQKMGLAAGEEISVEDLLYGLLIFSANDAAEVLAQNYPGGRVEFISEMNLKSQSLNLENSFFQNPSGLDGTEQLATARDLSRISAYAMKNPEFAKIVGTKERLVKSVDGKFAHKLTNINELVGEVDGVLGVKTGWTENARENLVTYVERDGKQIMITLLASQDRFGETKELISWIFESYTWIEISGPPLE
jgi:D-alanyl-D-alanine carboxypeptidase